MDAMSESDEKTLLPHRSLLKKLSSAGKTASLTSKPTRAGRVPSLTTRAAKESMTRKTSTTGSSKKKQDPSVKTLWYLRGSYVTVRNDEGGWFLCRLQTNVYNTTKSVKIRWLSKKKAGSFVDGDDYGLDYRDEFDPACILFNVRVTRDRSTYTLYDEDRLETEKLLKLVTDVASGKLTSEDVASDVEDVVQIEPPEKKRKTEINMKEAKTHNDGNEPKRKGTRKKEYLILHPNPDVKVWKKDPFFESNRRLPFVSEYAHSRLVFRAIHMKDYGLLKNLYKETVKIRRFDCWRSVADQTTGLHLAMTLRDKEAINWITKGYKELDSTVFEKRKESPKDNIHISKLETGSYNYRSLGVAYIRPIMASRGSREGNNALIKDLSDMKASSAYLQNWQYVPHMMNAGLDSQTIKEFYHGCSDFHYEEFVQCYQLLKGIDLALERGHYKQAGSILQDIVTDLPKSRRLTPLHFQALLSRIDLENVPPSHIRHGITLAGKITPIHCAACNPDTYNLEKLLQVEPDAHLSDRLNRRLIHFAAACEGTGPLELLIKRGANIFDCDHQGNTTLHFAARANRVNNVQLILKTALEGDVASDPCEGKYGIGGINRPNRNSYTPLHLAVENNNHDVVKVLVKNGATVDSILNTTSFKVTPLMLASQFGLFDIVVFLVRNGAVVQHRDRLGRTAVIHAAMNGNTNVLSYLLNIGASPKLCDTSGNSPLHYAAAYGWYFCVKTLLEAGADVNVSNDWKTTPLSIAYLKSHLGIVTFLLSETDSDVDFKDDQGMTLVSIAASSALYPDLYDQMHYLIKDKRAVCTFKDVDDATPLHHLARNNILLDGTGRDQLPNAEAMETSVKIAKLLIRNGCDPKAVDIHGMTAVMDAMRTGNVQLFKYLVQAGSPVITDPDKDGDTILHHLCYDHMETMKDYLAILRYAARMDGKSGTQNLKKDFCDMAKVYCQHGTTPLLAACHQYSIHGLKRMFGYHSDSELKTVTIVRWKRGRDLIKFLIDEFGSDVNAIVRERQKDNEKPKKQEDRRYRNRYDRMIADRRQEEFEAQTSYKHDNIVPKNVKWSVAQLLANVKLSEYGGHQKKKDPDWPALRMILQYHPDMNTRDSEGHTALTRALNDGNLTVARLLLKDSDADINGYCVQKDSRDQEYMTRPLMIAALSGNTSMFDLVLKAGADLGLVLETDGNTPFHAIIIKGDRADGTISMMQTLLNHGADINVRNSEKRTPLHLAVNYNKGKINDNFDLILALIDKGADLTSQDSEGRIPLHFVFGKYRRYNERQDPVELCHIIASKMKPEDLNIQSKIGMTALHTAASWGAQLCCIVLIQKGANVNMKNSDGNTALSLAVKENNDGCAAVLIQNGASVKDPVVYPGAEENEEPSQVWKWAPLRHQKKENDDKKLSLFECAVQNDLQGVCFLMMEKASNESGVTLKDAVETGLKLEKYNIVLRLLTTTADVSGTLDKDCEHGRNLLHVLSLTATNFGSDIEKVVTELVEKGVSLSQHDDYKCTPLLYASLRQNYGLCKFYMSAEAVYNAKYTDTFRRSVFAATFWKSPISFDAEFISWVSQLHEKKANLNELIDRPVHEGLLGAVDKESDPDYWRRYDCVKISPLIIAIHHLSHEFTQWILKKGANVNLADSAGRTPIMHAVRENNLDLVKTLMNFDFDPSSKEDDDSKSTEKIQPKKKIIGPRFQMKRKASQLSNKEDDGDSEEEEEIEEEKEKGEEETLKPYKKVSNVNLNAADRNGWTVMHHAVCPLPFGTFDNHEIVFILAKAGAELNVKNKKGETPLGMAVKKGAFRIAKIIQELQNVPEMFRREPVYSSVCVNDNMKWKNPRPSFHEDAERFLDTLEKPMDVEEEYESKINSNCDVTNGTLVKDEDQDLLYDVLLSKVDVSLGEWGLYNFYQMQLVHQRGKDLYILFTRWGRIGDDVGQFQHTPFKVKDDAVKEFCQIFQAKTGNKWAQVKSFENNTGKHRLVHSNERQTGRKQPGIEFENMSTVKSKLPPYLQHLMREMSDMKLMENTLRGQGLDTDIMPFGRIQRDRLLVARTLLEEIRVIVKEIETYRREKRNVTDEDEAAKLKDKYQRNCEQVGVLSSEYFQVIPQQDFLFEMIRPLDEYSKLKKQINLVSNLLDYEVASRMILGAKYREEDMNPLDYVYLSLGCQIQLLEEDDEESQYILKYISNSYRRKEWRGYLPSVKAIYRLQVEGEQTRMDKKNLGNHRLLWHGSGVGNFLSILQRGLVVAPPDPPKTGHLFGKGIYFSDLFSKSESYCSSSSSTNFMLLCEVALGKSMEINNDYRQKPEEGYDSLLVRGRERPDEKHNVRLHTGCLIPLGEASYANEYKGVKTNHFDNEYIVHDEAQVCLRYLVQF